MPLLLTDSTTDLVVRMLRLPERSSDSVLLVLLGLGLMLGGLIGLWVIGRLAEVKNRRGADAARLKRVLSGAELTPPEFDAFEEVVGASEASAIECATKVESFDRGVEILLRSAGKWVGEERLKELRSLRAKLGLSSVRPGSPLRSTRSLFTGQEFLVIPDWPGGDETIPAVLFAVEEHALTLRVEAPPEACPLLAACTELSLMFFRPGDASYAFRSKVLAVRQSSDMLVVLAHPDHLTRIQKRGFARVEVGARADFRWIPGARGAGTVHQGIVTDLSANGIGLRTDQPLESGDLVVLTLDFLPLPAGNLPFRAEVVVTRGDGSRGLKFEGLSPQARSEILKYVRSREVEKAAAKRGVDAGAPTAPRPETISEKEGEVKHVH